MIGEKLSKLRKENGISQEELAEKLNISRQAISKWENNESLPDTENLIAIAKLFNVSIDFLVGNKMVDSEQKNSTKRNIKWKNQIKKELLFKVLICIY